MNCESHFDAVCIENTFHKTVYRIGSECYLRLYDADNWSWWPSRERAKIMHREQEALLACAFYGVVAPRPLLCKTFSGLSLMLQTAIGSSISFVPPTNFGTVHTNCAAAAGRALRQLHDRTHGLPRLTHVYDASDMTKFLFALAPHCFGCRELESELVHLQAECCRLQLDVVDLDACRLLHGDFHLGNLVFANEHVVAGIIDWEEAAFGDPMHDVAHLLDLFVRTACVDAAVAFLCAYFYRPYNQRGQRRAAAAANADVFRFWLRVTRLKRAAMTDGARLLPFDEGQVLERICCQVILP